MTQADLELDLRRVTGESMGIIRKHGFSILPTPEEFGDDEPDIRIIDWDEQDAIRRRAA